MGVARHCLTKPLLLLCRSNLLLCRKKTMLSSFFLSLCLTFPYLSSTEPCPDPFVTIYNRACSSDCAQYGEEYLWCRMSDGDWDYCSGDYRHTRYGEACVDGCSRRGETYYWCHKVVGGWDYCSSRCDGIHTAK